MNQSLDISQEKPSIMWVDLNSAFATTEQDRKTRSHAQKRAAPRNGSGEVDHLYAPGDGRCANALACR